MKWRIYKGSYGRWCAISPAHTGLYPSNGRIVYSFSNWANCVRFVDYVIRNPIVW